MTRLFLIVASVLFILLVIAGATLAGNVTGALVHALGGGAS